MSPFIIKIRYEDGERVLRDSWVPSNDTWQLLLDDRPVRSIVILRRK